MVHISVIEGWGGVGWDGVGWDGMGWGGGGGGDTYISPVIWLFYCCVILPLSCQSGLCQFFLQT